MATFTPNKALPQPTVGGDQSGAWGTLLNQGMAIIDNALGASNTIAAGGTVTTIALSGTAAQDLIQVVNGTLAANTEVLLPPVGGFYIFDNETSGTFVATVGVGVSAALGGTVTLSQGKREIVYSDGVNARSATDAYIPNGGTGTLSSLTVSGLMSAGTVVASAGAGSGFVEMLPGGTATPGLVGFFNQSGTRVGYVGWSSGTNLLLETENGFTGWSVVGNLSASGNFAATGSVTVGGALSLTGSLTASGKTALNNDTLIVGSSSTNLTNSLRVLNPGGSVGLSVTGNSLVVMPGVVANTTGNAANIFMDGSGILYQSVSSRRFKRTIKTFLDPLAAACKLRFVRYKSRAKADGDTQFAGFIAEEVHAAGLHEFVAYDAKGRPNAVHYGPLAALAIGAVSELAKTVESLAKRVSALEKRR